MSDPQETWRRLQRTLQAAQQRVSLSSNDPIKVLTFHIRAADSEVEVDRQGKKHSVAY